MTMATTTTWPPSRWSIMKAHIARTALGTFRAYLEMSPRPHLGPPRILWMGIGEGSGESPRLPITNCLSATPLSVGAFATKVNMERGREMPLALPKTDGLPRKKLLEGQNGRLRCTLSALPSTFTRFSSVVSWPHPSPGTNAGTKLAELVKRLE